MTEILSSDATQKLLKGITIPPQPQLMVDLQMELAMPDPSFETIAAIITKDIGIAGSTLKVVNSPFFGLRSKITSIRQALNLLGLRNVINVVNSLSLRNSFSFATLADMTRVWDNAMDVAMASAAIAKLIGIASQDEAYTLGLFHDGGIPLMMDRYVNYLDILSQAYGEPGRRITDVENAAFDTNHAVVGYFVAKAWKLPNHLSQAIADHHKTGPIFADQVQCDPREKNLLAVLKLAENICRSCEVLVGEPEDYEFQKIKKDLLIYLGLSDYDYDDLKAEIRELS